MCGVASKVSRRHQEVRRNLSLDTQIPVLDAWIGHGVSHRRLERGSQRELRFTPVENEWEWIATGNSQPGIVKPALRSIYDRAYRVGRGGCEAADG